jgi:MtN3 and saliva related transmembrane protein
MSFVDILVMFVAIYGMIMNSSFVPQIYRIIKRKSSEDISLTTYLIMTPGFAVWFIYGIFINNLPLIFANIIGLLNGISMTIVTLVYRKRKNNLINK